MAGVSQLNTGALHMCMCVHTCTHTHMQETLTLSLSRPRSSGNLEFTQVIRSICYWGGGGGVLRTQSVIRVPTVNHLSCPSLKGQPLLHSAPCGLYWLPWRKPSEKVVFLFLFFSPILKKPAGPGCFLPWHFKETGSVWFQSTCKCQLSFGTGGYPLAHRKGVSAWGLMHKGSPEVLGVGEYCLQRCQHLQN